ncbi:DUF6048 family protein [Psychroflexus montanilacus]|uniref:DUF6048 family protein n=1 Tax=Psychroflexus montanilacus TaxID=2873598 RepID=UPI001CCEFFAD|nr:DUF6048 family protein [Psychroflexus montanilacus]MBZ9652939.1 DUF6048 family protein [Psychroflexus montanilacus]
MKELLKMNLKLICLYIISILFFFYSATSIAQEDGDADYEQVSDSIFYKDKYGLTVSLDLSRIGQSFWDSEYQGIELAADYRFSENLYIAGELGNEKATYDNENLLNETDGSYIKLGVNYNVYDNWIGMNNLIYVGFRYGFATYSQNLQSFRIYTTDDYFPPDVRDENTTFGNLTANWVELQAGLRVNIFGNFFLGAHIQLKNMISTTDIQNFDNLYVPGFRRTFDNSSIGAGWGYSISYLIPIYSKTKTQAVDN